MIQTSGIRSALASFFWWLVPWLIGYAAGIAVANAFAQIKTVPLFERFLLGLLLALALEFAVLRAARRRFGQRATDFVMWLIVGLLVGAAR